MNRHTVLLQALVADALLWVAVGCGATVLVSIALSLCAGLVLETLVLGGLYLWSRDSHLPSRPGERDIPALTAILPAMSAVVALVLVSGGHTSAWFEDHHVPDLVCAAVIVFFAVILGSSIVDWYWVTPRRDGRIGLPPCRTDAPLPGRRALTRVLVIHRIVAAGTAAVAGSIVIYSGVHGLTQLAPSGSLFRSYLQSVAAPLSVLVAAMTTWLKGFNYFFPRVFGTLPVKFGDVAIVDSGNENFVGVVMGVSLENIEVANETAVKSPDIPDASLRVRDERHRAASGALCEPNLCKGLNPGGHCVLSAVAP